MHYKPLTAPKSSHECNGGCTGLSELEENNCAKWELTMAPGQEMTLSLPIQIEYPNDVQILGL